MSFPNASIGNPEIWHNLSTGLPACLSGTQAGRQDRSRSDSLDLFRQPNVPLRFTIGTWRG